MNILSKYRKTILITENQTRWRIPSRLKNLLRKHRELPILGLETLYFETGTPTDEYKKIEDTDSYTLFNKINKKTYFKILFIL